MNPDAIADMIRQEGPLSAGEIMRRSGATLREVKRAIHALVGVRRTHRIGRHGKIYRRLTATERSFAAFAQDAEDDELYK